MAKNLQQKLFNDLRKAASELYVNQAAVRHIIIATGISQGEIDLNGTAQNMWDSFLSVAEDKNKIGEIVQLVLGEYPDNEVFKNAAKALADGSAFIEEIDIDTYLKPNNERAVKTLIVYDQKDLTIVKSFRNHLYALELVGDIQVKDLHQDVGAGTDRERRYLELLGEADVVLLMLTGNFFSPDNSCMKLAFAGFEMRKVVVPVLVTNTLWGRIKILKDIVPLPVNGMPVSQWGNKDEALYTIAEGVGRVAARLRQN